MFIWIINARILYNLYFPSNTNETNASKECDICHCCYFLDKDFKYEPYLGNSRHDLMQKVISFNNFAIAYVKGSIYRIHFWYMRKDDAINIMENYNLKEKKRSL